MTAPAIAVLPHGNKLGSKLAGKPLDDLVWPLGRPERLNEGTVADLLPTDHLIIFPKTNMHFLPRLGTRAHVSVMVVEPSVVHARHLRWLRFTYRRFFRVLTYHEVLLRAVPNGLFLPYGTTWVPDYATFNLEKTKNMSLIASSKRDYEGHKLRHDLVQYVQREGLDVDVLGRGYAPFEKKSDGLASFRFSVVVENARERNYFSEKLVDAMLCDTVPIYWGCPNIADFIDPAGMILCEREEEMKAAITSATPEQYAALLPALHAAKAQAASYDNLERRAAETLKASL